MNEAIFTHLQKEMEDSVSALAQGIDQDSHRTGIDRAA